MLFRSNDERRRVTPAAFWWDGVDEVTQVSNVDPDTEQIDIYMSGEFEEMYSRLLTRPAD